MQLSLCAGAEWKLAKHEVLKSLHCYCPICFELKEDVEVLPHFNPIGDVSNHKMCGDCRAEYKVRRAPSPSPRPRPWPRARPRARRSSGDRRRDH